MVENSSPPGSATKSTTPTDCRSPSVFCTGCGRLGGVIIRARLKHGAGVWGWFAPIGDRFRQKIEDVTRLYDKLLVVLTESSIKSAWVEKEVESVFEKERKQGKTVLFPIRLDEAVIDAEEAWAADIRRTRHI